MKNIVIKSILVRGLDITFGQTRSEKTGNLFDKTIGGQESIVFLGKFFHEFLVLVKSFLAVEHLFE